LVRFGAGLSRRGRAEAGAKKLCYRRRVLDKEGKSDFDALASRRHDKWAQLYAFDMLAGDGEDLRPWPLALRKGALTGLLQFFDEIKCDPGLQSEERK
jgi:ATP-dependent DNA ligase